MRIVYVFRSLAIWGGIERVLVDKMNYFINVYGYEVYLLTTCQGKHLVPFELDAGVHVEDLGIQFHFQYRYKGFRRLYEDFCRTKLFERRFARRIKYIQPDIIVCTTTDPVLSIVRVKGDIPLVVESHNICIRALGERGPHQRLIAWQLKKGLKKSSCLVSLTEADGKDWKALGMSVKVIPNVVHINKKPPSSLLNHRVIWVGRFDYQKRPVDIIKLWKVINQRFPDWELHIYGEGEYRAELEEMLRRTILNIYIHEPTKDIFNKYLKSSILVSTSLFEPFGLVLPEAMSCGLPVVAFDCPYGPGEIITDGKDGFLVGNWDVEEFAVRVCQLIENEDLRCQMGQCGIESSQRYQADRIMPMWKELFQSLIHSKDMSNL